MKQVNEYWKVDWNYHTEERIWVRTSDDSIADKMGKPDAEYTKKGKTFAVQYLVEMGSEKQEKLFKLLKLTPANEIKKKRERKGA